MEKMKKARLLFLLLALVLPLLIEGLYSGQTLPVEGPAQLERPVVALTFDDGPRRSTTTQLLDGLAQRGVTATFFLIGEQVEGNEDIIRRMDAEGHQLGVHTWDHVQLTGLGPRDFYAQVERTRSLLAQTVGRESFALRPPYGMVDNGVKKRSGAPIILWSIDPTDWDDKNTQRVVAEVAAQAGDGDIILLHDIYPTSVEAALQIVDILHARGFLFVTVEELASQRHVALEPGETYCDFHP